MSPAISPGRSWSVVCRRGGLALALVAALLASSWGPRTSLLAQPAALPPDLAAVPADAVSVNLIRVSDLWRGELGMSVRKHGGKQLEQLLAEMEKNLGFSLTDVERVIYAFTVPEGGIAQGPSTLFLITASKAYSREHLLKALAPEAAEHKHKGKSYYARKEAPADSGFAVAFLNDRLLAVGEARVIRQVLEREPGMESKGRLSQALRGLATSKHHAHAIMPLSSLFKEFPQDLPPEAEPFKPLLKAELLTQTVDLGKDIRIDLILNFANAAEAQAGAKAVKDALEVLRPLIAQAVPELEQSVAKEVPELGKVVKAAVAALDKVKAEQTGTEVKVVLRMEVNAAELVATLLPAVQKVRTAANRMTSTNNLKQIALAFHNHESHENHLPLHAIYSKDGKPLLSWRVRILPYLVEDDLYKEFKLDEPWDSPHNKKLLARMPKTYAPVERPTKEPNLTFYQVFTGQGTVFDGQKKMGFQHILDGTSNTLMVVEAGEAVPWTKPEDLPYDPKKPLPKLGGLFPDLPTFNAAFCDGSVRAFSKQFKESVLRALITPAGGEVISAEDLNK